MNFIKFKLDFLIDLFWPKFCLGCGQIGAYLCLKCQNKIKIFNKEICFYCSRPSPLGLTHPNCKKPGRFDGFWALYEYKSIIRDVIKEFKYRRATEIWREMSFFIKPENLLFLKRWPKIDFFQPIPLYKKKMNERGFNQAKIIANFLKKYHNLPIADFVWRVKNTKSQTKLKTDRQRLINLKGAFRLNDNKKQIIKNANILLIDDVVTTGATVNQATKVLKKAGAGQIFVFALAKG